MVSPLPLLFCLGGSGLSLVGHTLRLMCCSPFALVLCRILASNCTPRSPVVAVPHKQLEMLQLCWSRKTPPFVLGKFTKPLASGKRCHVAEVLCRFFFPPLSCFCFLSPFSPLPFSVCVGEARERNQKRAIAGRKEPWGGGLRREQSAHVFCLGFGHVGRLSLRWDTLTTRWHLT